MEKWPEHLLPLPRIEPISMEVSNSTIRTQMDSGRYRQRQRFTEQFETYEAQWIFTDSEFHIFKSWIANVISQGADTFEIHLSTGGGLNEKKARFVNGEYSSESRHPNWVVTAQIEIENPELLSKTDIEGMS